MDNFQQKDNNKEKDHYLEHRITILLRWVILSILTGMAVGAVSSVLALAVKYVTGLRETHNWFLYALPAAGLLIVLLYRACGITEDKGTNLVIQSIVRGDHLPPVMAPLILVSTVLTHMFGGSSGRESAGLQIGGCIGHNIGKFCRLTEEDNKTITMCGMSAAFSALFGTPMAAAFFAMEIESVGVMYYNALIPCVISALVSKAFAGALGIAPEFFSVRIMPEISVNHMVLTAFFAVLCAALSYVFCISVHGAGKLMKKIENQYLRIVIGGCAIIAMTLLSGTRFYNGASMGLISMSFSGIAPYEAFLLKMIFTAVTLGAGFKGGEIVPSLCIGAAFGCTAARLLGFEPGICSAIGMTAMFCGVTNCPITSLLISFELFGYEGMPYYLLAIAFSYTLSGYHGLYSSQKIMYSKFHNRYVNRDTK